LASRIANFSEDTIVSIGDINPGKFIESDETTHYSIVDSYGNAVSVTTTLNGGYGSKLFDPELGFFYNNEMDDFSSKPGVPNMFGLVGSEANSIAPGKRMLSSMTPTIVEKDNQLLLVVGTPGGSTIITAVAQVILRSIYYNTPMQKAVDAARFHHQGVPDLLILEPNRFNSVVIDSLKRLGYTISEKTNRIIGKVNAIRITEDGKLETGADSRGDEASSGF
jgi:gamma-glutamyltranspeptidase/glutathione hydrolase